MVRILLSKCHANATARNSMSKGDKVLWTSQRTGITIEVTIDSELMRHNSAPGDGLGYECVFSDTGERGFASANFLAWPQDVIDEGNKFRASM